MNLDELLALIAEEHREKVKAFFTGLSDKIDSLSNEITELEKKADNPDLQGKLDDAIAKRDAAKSQLKIVRDALGLPAEKEVTSELVADHMKDASKGDAEKDKRIRTLEADITSLEQSVETLKTEKAEVEQERDQVSEETKFIKVFSESMPDFKAASPVARVDIERLLRVDAVLEDGQILYKGKDGSYVRVKGEKVDMKAKLAEIQDNPDYGYLFESKASGGSGSGNGKGSGTASRFEQRKRAANIA